MTFKIFVLLHCILLELLKKTLNSVVTGEGVREAHTTLNICIHVCLQMPPVLFLNVPLGTSAHTPSVQGHDFVGNAAHDR
jgi:hypothetical protein